MLRVLISVVFLSHILNAAIARNSPLELNHTSELSTEEADVVRKRWEKHCLLSSRGSHRRHLSDECVVHFLHIHKTGGTTMCNTALHNNFRVTGNNNCNTPLAVSLNDKRNPELGIAQQYILDNKLSFVGQEYALFQPNISSDQFIHMITVRHPADRLVSHLHHAICEGSQTNAIHFLDSRNCTTIKNIKTFTLSDLVLDSCFLAKPPSLSPITMDFYINSMMKCQPHCTKADLRSSLIKLHYFSAIIMTDTPEQYDK